MSKWSRKRKQWHDYRCKKLNIKKKKYRRSYITYIEEGHEKTVYEAKESIKHRINITAPDEFSIINNTEETYEYFNELVNHIKEKKYATLFYFKMKNVKKLTVDAIIYTLAIQRNINEYKQIKFRYIGDRPDNNEMYEYLKESGFFNFVNTKLPVYSSKSNKIQITTDKFVDTCTAKRICDFINQSLNTRKGFTDELYDVIIELMTNTVQHAYEDNEILKVNQWYIYVEDNDGVINLVFVDTGHGIPETIRKSIPEKLAEALRFEISDSQYIKSAFKGEFRSQTEDAFRGKGLPSIVEYAQRDEVFDFIVFSGKGCCEISNRSSDIYITTDYDKGIFGTLFSWKIVKSRIKEEYYNGD